MRLCLKLRLCPLWRGCVKRRERRDLRWRCFGSWSGGTLCCGLGRIYRIFAALGRLNLCRRGRSGNCLRRRSGRLNLCRRRRRRCLRRRRRKRRRCFRDFTRNGYYRRVCGRQRTVRTPASSQSVGKHVQNNTAVSRRGNDKTECRSACVNTQGSRRWINADALNQ